MSVRKHRLAIAGVIAAAAIALPTAALASSPSTTPGKPAPSATASKSPAPNASAAASKSAAASSSAAASKTAARQSPALRGSLEQALVAALASQLGVSDSTAQHALHQIQSLGKDGVDPASPAFAAIARGLGVTPGQLAAALRGGKQAARQSLGGK